jgi:hypothetical protein
MEILLVGPSGQTVVLLADVGGSTDITNVNLTFADSAPLAVPTPIVSGTFRPTSLGAFTGPAPAPPGPYGAALSIFNGTVPNGQWRLFVFDDAAGDTGAIVGGWSLDVTTNGPTLGSFAPLTGPPGTTVVLTGTNLTGTSAVSFGGTPAASFAVVSPTQVTAVVPAGATTGPISVTTPNGTTSTATAFQASPAPTVTSVAPGSGEVGDSVTIAGTNLTGATAVSFAGTPAATFSVASPTSITATVPAGAGAGNVTVTTPGGTGTSPQPFAVSHDRRISLAMNRRRARGTVTATDGFAKCASGVRINVQRRARGRWRTVARDLTNANGRYSIPGRRAAGRYRAVAPATTLAGGDQCQRARSRSDRVRR